MNITKRGDQFIKIILLGQYSAEGSLYNLYLKVNSLSNEEYLKLLDLNDTDGQNSDTYKFLQDITYYDSEDPNYQPKYLGLITRSWQKDEKEKYKIMDREINQHGGCASLCIFTEGW